MHKTTCNLIKVFQLLPTKATMKTKSELNTIWKEKAASAFLYSDSACICNVATDLPQSHLKCLRVSLKIEKKNWMFNSN